MDELKRPDDSGTLKIFPGRVAGRDSGPSGTKFFARVWASSPSKSVELPLPGGDMSRNASKILSRVVIAAAIVITITTLASAGAFTGQWYVEPSSKPDEVQMTLRYERHWDGGNYNTVQSFDLPTEKAVGLTAEALNSSGT